MKNVNLGVEAGGALRSGWSVAAEFAVAIAALALFVAFATAVCSRKSPHADEVIDAEVAVNLVQHGQPVSYAFSYTTPGTPAATGWPAYEYALAAWLSVWGVSRPAVLSFYITIAAVVSLLMLVVVRRTRLVDSPAARILLSVAIPLLPAVASVYSKNRYDAMGMLGLAVATFALTVQRPWWRYGLVVGGGLSVGAGGFDVVIASGPLAMLLIMCTGRRFLPEAVVYLASVGLGLGSAFGLMYVNGTLDDFFECMRLSGVKAGAAARGASLGLRMVEPALVAVVVGAALVDGWRDVVTAARRALHWIGAAPAPLPAVGGYARGATAMQSDGGARVPRHVAMSWKMVLVGVGAAVLIPTCIGSVGHYSREYRWLSAIPAFMAAAIIAAQARTTWLRVGTAAALVPIVASGLPASALVIGTEWAEQDYAPIQRFVAERIAADDVVFASWPLFYPVKRAGTPAFIGGAFHRMTDAQKQAITVAFFAGRDNGVGFLDPTIDDALKGFGGDWKEVDSLVVPRGALRSRIPPAPKSSYCYEVRVFQRTNTE